MHTISALQDREVIPAQTGILPMAEISMTTDHKKPYRDLVDEAVLIMAGSPLVERPNLASKLAMSYEERFAPSGLSPDIVTTLINLWLDDVLRRLDEIDRLLSPLRVAVAAEHGALIRLPSGEVHGVPATRCPPPEWIEQLRHATRSWNGILVEEKIYSVALHYRLAPDRQRAIRQLAMSLVRLAPDRFELLAAKEAFEIRPKGITKGQAVELLMNHEPFRARQPVFVGDDVTDEDGMEVAVRLGGLGLNVGAVFEGQPLAVRAWLERAADTLR
jgi:trehalose 6-phosphate phosphatase